MRVRSIAAVVAVVAAAGCSGESDAERAAAAAERAAAATKDAAAATQQAASAAQQTAAAAGQAAPGAKGSAQEQLAQGMQQVAQGLQQMQAAQGDVINHDQLKAFLPETLGTWTRRTSRSHQVALPFKVSNAEAQYQNGDSTMDVKIMDAALSQMILAPMSMFLVAGYEEKTDDGYKKYSPVAGSPGFEEWQARTKRGEMTVILNNRFVVQATGHNVDGIAPVRAALQSLELTRLAAMK